MTTEINKIQVLKRDAQYYINELNNGKVANKKVIDAFDILYRAFEGSDEEKLKFISFFMMHEISVKMFNLSKKTINDFFAIIKNDKEVIKNALNTLLKYFYTKLSDSFKKTFDPFNTDNRDYFQQFFIVFFELLTHGKLKYMSSTNRRDYILSIAKRKMQEYRDMNNPSPQPTEAHENILHIYEYISIHLINEYS